MKPQPVPQRSDSTDDPTAISPRCSVCDSPAKQFLIGAYAISIENRCMEHWINPELWLVYEYETAAIRDAVAVERML